MKPHPLLSRLLAVRAGGARIEKVSRRDRSMSLAAAYSISAALTADQPVVGYKIGATSERGRQILGLRVPFYGRIMVGTLYRSPATVRLGGRTLAVEAEIGCELGADLPSRPTRYSRAEVAAAVRKVLPLVELNAPSYTEPLVVGGRCLIADNGVNVGAVVGVAGSTDLYTIRDAQVSVTVDGVSKAEGTPAVAPDDPLSCLTWLANTLSRHGHGLRDGQVIATGTLTAPLNIATDCSLEADFGALGRVQIAFVR